MASCSTIQRWGADTAPVTGRNAPVWEPVVLVVVGAVLVVAGACFAEPGSSLREFVPLAHRPGPTRHRTTHGIAARVVAEPALSGALMSAGTHCSIPRD